MKPVEILTLAPLGALVVVFGIFPALLLDLFSVTVEEVLAAVGPAIELAAGR
jgi:NADH:ubiquinone oxidoreductase subunit 4 (subunit M)